jgi:hypothetical protein
MHPVQGPATQIGWAKVGEGKEERNGLAQAPFGRYSFAADVTSAVAVGKG